MTWALEKIRPRLHLGGHMTGGCFTYHDFGWGKHLRVDTSARHRCYAVLEGRTVTVYQRGVNRFISRILDTIMKFWIEVACSSVEEVADVIARALESKGCTVNVRWEQSFHFPQEYVRVDGVEVIDEPFGKFEIMAYFTVKKTLKKPDRCEVKAGYLVKVLEDRLNNPDSFAVSAAIKGMAEGLVNAVMREVFFSLT